MLSRKEQKALKIKYSLYGILVMAMIVGLFFVILMINNVSIGLGWIIGLSVIAVYSYFLPLYSLYFESMFKDTDIDYHYGDGRVLFLFSSFILPVFGVMCIFSDLDNINNPFGY